MKTEEIDIQRIENAVREILYAIGDNPDREGLIGTPNRIARMYSEIFEGISKEPKRHLKIVFEEENYNELILIKDIPFYSMCEHHLVPFWGKAHIGYIPSNGKITGLSKIARVLEEYSKRPQLQERLTSQISDAILEELEPSGVIVVIEAEHMCMTMRGIKKAGSKTITSAVRGIFKDDSKSRAEALALIALS